MPAVTTAPAPAPVPAVPHLVRVGAVTIPAQPAPPAQETIDATSNVVPLAVPEAAPASGAGMLLRVERGAATAEEIAAVTAVLLSRAAAAREAEAADHAAGFRRRAAARWRSHGFAGPRAWTASTRDLLAG